MKLSIITVCKNEVQGIARTIESVLNQNFDDFEYIVWDGGSTDGTQEIISKYSSSIDTYISEQDLGVYDAMNKSLVVAKGEYILFLNGGDYFFTKDSLSQIFRQEPNSEILLCDILIAPGESPPVRASYPSRLDSKFWLNSSPYHPSTLVKRDLFNTIGNFDLRFQIASDYDFFIRAFLIHRCSYKIFPVALSVFEATKGLSSRPENWQKIQIERFKILLSRHQWGLLLRFLTHRFFQKLSLICRRFFL